MPESYIEQIMDGGETVSQLEVLEANVSESMHQVEHIINQIKRIYETDTTYAWAEDSLMSLLGWHNNLFSKYELAFKHLYNGDTELMDDLLEALPEEFAMEDPEWAAHQDYIDYIEMLALLQVEERLPEELTAEEIEILMTLAANERSYSSAWARTLLTLSNTGYLYQEPIIIDQEYMPRKGRKITVVNHLMPTISVYPNPANELLNIVLSECFINQNDCLVVSDISGKEVYKLVLSAAQQGCIIDVTKWKDGVYIISLWQNGQKSLHKIVSICR
jgi:hypothetical protein